MRSNLPVKIKCSGVMTCYGSSVILLEIMVGPRIVHYPF